MTRIAQFVTYIVFVCATTNAIADVPCSVDSCHCKPSVITGGCTSSDNQSSLCNDSHDGENISCAKYCLRFGAECTGTADKIYDR